MEQVTNEGLLVQGTDEPSGGVPDSDADAVPLNADEPAQAPPLSPKDEGISPSGNMETRLRAQALWSQAQTIQAISGADVMALYETDMEVRARVLRGEWDFMDVWKSMDVSTQPPAPMRSANGGVGQVNIGAMSDTQFRKLNETLAHGGRIDMNHR